MRWPWQPCGHEAVVLHLRADLDAAAERGGGLTAEIERLERELRKARGAALKATAAHATADARLDAVRAILADLTLLPAVANERALRALEGGSNADGN
jgi:hypothetical protein